MTDTFSKYHPAVNFLFFLGAIGCAVVFQHPAYLAAGIVTGAVYYLIINGKKGVKMLLGMVPLFLFLTAINPLFNTYGSRVLFRIGDRPYTYEALMYGVAVAAMFVTMLLWFGCYNKVLTSDKFTSLFGNLIPALSLLLVMILRMVPNFIRKAKQLSGARKAIGKGAGESKKEKLLGAASLLGALTTWALEGGIVTGDSMRARGYGSAKRTSFMRYQMTGKDWALLILMLALMTFTVVAACLGQTAATYTPKLSVAPVSWGVIPYAIYLLIPIVLSGKEALQWRISRSKI